MSNEVKEKWIDYLAVHMNSHLTMANKIEHFLDQFEGYKLVKESRVNMECSRCGAAVCVDGETVQELHLYHNTKDRATEWLCKSCFDALCPEPAAKLAEPELWAEFLQINGSRYLLGNDRTEKEEARWKEIQRRVSRMIDEKLSTHLNAAQVSKLIADSIAEAIKMERAHTANAFRLAGFGSYLEAKCYEVAELIERDYEKEAKDKGKPLG